MFVPLVVLLAFLAINLMTFVRFGTDKQRAIAGQRRVSEQDLLTLAFFGGTPAAYAARHVFRHKTRKQPFSNQLATIAMIQAGVVMGLIAAQF